MCGILFYHGDESNIPVGETTFQEFGETEITDASHNWNLTSSEKFNNIVPYIVSRGPNYCSLRSSGKNLWFSSILSLRAPFTKQSVLVGERFVLQYNGELYNEELVTQDLVLSDTQFIADLLTQYPEDISRVVKSMYGEFAYTVYDILANKIYFGRDRIGKRSLSYQLNDITNELYITSCSGKDQGVFHNCDSNKIYEYDFKSSKLKATDLSSSYSVSTQEGQSTPELESQLYGHLNESVRIRTQTIHPMHEQQNNALAILFSGGLDCSVIAALVCKNLKPGSIVELLNVGFENPRTKMNPADVPDRILGWKSYESLAKLFPEIDLRFVEVDVPYEEYLAVKDRVVDLIYPKETEMDLSIAIAFYFASRGRGFHNKTAYDRKSLVLFSGLGADELYGGYHKFANKSVEELAVELTGQINNIHDRNLNRDDKVIASNGVEVRYPFLDERVVGFSTSKIPISCKINKLILRNVAHDSLKLDSIAQEPKRAIQFGAKSAKMVKGQTKGTDLI